VSEEPPSGERVRAPQVAGALCLATDLGMGVPFAIGLAVQALPDADRRAVTAQCESALEPFRVTTGYEIPCVAVCAVAQ
jgi:hypothetical protein